MPELCEQLVGSEKSDILVRNSELSHFAVQEGCRILCLFQDSRANVDIQALRLKRIDCRIKEVMVQIHQTKPDRNQGKVSQYP